jgi:hypothetical protein
MLSYFELAKALHRDGQDERALGLLHKMEGLHDQMYDDRIIRRESAEYLREWAK